MGSALTPSPGVPQLARHGAGAAAVADRAWPRLDQGQHMTRIQLMAQPADVAGGWAPECWLGAPAPGGLALPAARPTLSWLYGPRGVCLDSDHLVVADSGNHRVLVWHGVPQRD